MRQGAEGPARWKALESGDEAEEDGEPPASQEPEGDSEGRPERDARRRARAGEVDDARRTEEGRNPVEPWEAPREEPESERHAGGARGAEPEARGQTGRRRTEEVSPPRGAAEETRERGEAGKTEGRAPRTERPRESVSAPLEAAGDPWAPLGEAEAPEPVPASRDRN